MKNKMFLGMATLFVGILVSSSIMPLSFAATLTNEIVEPSNNLFGLESHYVIGFTTATMGTIKVITITFPAGLSLTNAKLILASGIGPGTISVTGQTVTYTVNSAVLVPAVTNIIIDLGKIVNNAVTSNTISITTRDSLNIIIDGPTVSPAFTLTSVTSTLIQNGAITNTKVARSVINSTHLQNGAVTNTKIAKNVINGTQIIDGTIVNADISPTAAILLTKLAVGLLPSGITINSANIVDGSIVNADLSNLASIDLSKLATGALPSGITVNSANIVDGSITSADMAPNSLSDPRFGINTNWASGGIGRDCTIGEIILSAGTIANGIPADGHLLLINQNGALFSLLGSTYGGDGITTFAIPDLRSAAPNGLTYSICISGIYPTQR